MLVLMSDINIHFDIPGKSDVARVLSSLSANGLVQNISEPTHRLGHTLDPIITRVDGDSLMNYKVHVNHISDYHVVCASLRVSHPELISTKISYRNFKDMDHSNFASELAAKLDAPKASNGTADECSINKIVSEFDSVAQETLDSTAPMKTVTVKARRRPRWYNSTIGDSRRKRRRCERRWGKHKTGVNLSAFQAAKLHVKKCITMAKCEYFTCALEKFTPKTAFQVLNRLLNTNEKVLPVHDLPAELADRFANFFTDKVLKIRNELDGNDPDPMFTSCCNQGIGLQFREFTEVSESEVENIIKRSSSKSCSLDPLPTWLLKKHLRVVLPELVHLTNQVLSSGVFPTDLKEALVLPVIKKASLDRNDLRSYRPVSNIPFRSKIVERIMLRQLTEHIQDNGLTEPMQSAYKEHHSTETALLKIQTDLLQAIDSQKGVMMVLLDLSAAFDTVDHKILLNRLEDNFGITGLALKLIHSYLEDRNSHVLISGQLSKACRLPHGIPQGSVIGPLFFTLYIRPIGNILRAHGVFFHMYADDIQIYVMFDPTDPVAIDAALGRLSSCITEIQRWMNANKLKLNDGKTEFFVSASPHHRSSLLMNDVKLMIGEKSFQPCKSIRNLGVTLEPSVNLSHHVNLLSRSIKYHLRNLWRVRRFIDKSTCHAAARALVLSRLDYCNSLFSVLSQRDLDRLQRLQNSAARLVFSAPLRTHIQPLRLELHWLPVRQRIAFKILLLVYKYLNHRCPPYIADCLVRRPSSPKYPLIIIPLAHSVSLSKKRAGELSFPSVAAKLWNQLPSASLLCRRPHLLTSSRNCSSHIYSARNFLLPAYIYFTDL